MIDRIGKQIGQYRLLHRLGQGGFAEVYLGQHIFLNTQAALKILHAPLVTNEELERFRQEAQIIAALRHAHIVRVLEFGVEAGIAYLVMDYASGGSLRQRHPTGTRVSPRLIATYVAQTAQALQYAHAQKVIHRDIKPENLLLSEQNEVLLSDFGISIIAESSSRQRSQGFAGTVAYAAPEQLQERPRPASDQYSLGVVVYEWLCGKLPFTGGLAEVVGKHLTVPPPSLCAQIPSLPQSVEEVVFQALAKDPKERFAGVQTFATAFEQAVSAIPSMLLDSTLYVPAPTSPQPAGQAPSRSLAHPTQPAISPPNIPPDNQNIAPAPASATPRVTLPLTLSSDTLSPLPPGTAPTRKIEPQKIAQRFFVTLKRKAQRPQTTFLLQICALTLTSLLLVITATFSMVAVLTSKSASPLQAAPGARITASATLNPTPTFTVTPTIVPAPLAASYIAPVPGPNCDQSGGEWTINAATVSCTDNGMELRQQSSDTAGTAFFKWPGHAFTPNYRVSVDVKLLPDTSLLFPPTICATILIHYQASRGYVFFICDEGTWAIYRYDTDGTKTQLAGGSVSGSDTYHLQVTTQGSAQQFTIDQGTPDTATDATYQNTTVLGLAVFTSAGFLASPAPGTAAFKNFIYTPLL